MVRTRVVAPRPLLLVLLIALQVAVPLLCGAALFDLAHGAARSTAATLSHAHASNTGHGHPGPEHVHSECSADWVCLVSPQALRCALPHHNLYDPDIDRAPAPCYEVPAPVPIRA